MKINNMWILDHYFLPITLCVPKREMKKSSALRKLSDESPILFERHKGIKGYSIALIKLGPSPNTNEVKNSLVSQKNVWIMGHLLFS